MRIFSHRFTMLAAATLLAVAAPASLHKAAAQQQAAAPAAAPATTSNTGVTVDKGPLFLNNIVNRIKNTFRRDTAPATVQPVSIAPPRAASTATTTTGAGLTRAQIEAKQQAYWARNRAIANALNQKVDQEMAQRAQQIQMEKMQAAARAAGQPVPTAPAGMVGGVAVPGQPVVPTQVIIDKPVDSSQPKPIFNNYR